MLRMRFLLAEKDSRIRTPVECHFAALRIAEDGRRCVPRKRWSYSVEIAPGASRRMISVETHQRHRQDGARRQDGAVREVFHMQIRPRPNIECRSGRKLREAHA